MLLLISTMKLLYISDEEPQNNRNHPGKISYQCDADLLFFQKKSPCLFLPHFFFVFLPLSVTPFLLSIYMSTFIISLSTPKHPLSSLSFSLQSGVLPLAAGVFGL